MERRILSIGGEDRLDFLQGLVTNDLRRDGLIHAALLTPQGKYIADFFLLKRADDILLDVAEAQADDLVRRLSMYRLRAKVTLAPRAPIVVARRSTTSTVRQVSAMVMHSASPTA